MYDCIVVGAGIIGACAAYNLVKLKSDKRILVIDQFPLPHCRGSSHGPIRNMTLCQHNPVCTKMAIDAMPMWKQLEEEAGTTLVRKTGTLYVEEYPFTDINKRKRNAIKNQLRYDILDSSEIKRRFPGILDVKDHQKAFFDLDSCTVKSDKAIRCLMEQIKAHGGDIRDCERVESIIPGNVVTVRTSNGSYSCQTLIVAAGSWAGKLLKPLGVNPPLRITRSKVCYFKEPTPRLTASYPVVIDRAVVRPKGLKETYFGYAFPSDEYPGLRKIGIHHGTVVDPDHRDGLPEEKESVKMLFDYVKSKYPGSGTTPSLVEPCIYSDTPDHDFILDTVPHQPNIAYCCGLSGIGFVSGMGVGRLLAELAFGEKPSYDITPLRLSRFPQTQIPAKY